jgi:hypothetical protein
MKGWYGRCNPQTQQENAGEVQLWKYLRIWNIFRSISETVQNKKYSLEQHFFCSQLFTDQFIHTVFWENKQMKSVLRNWQCRNDRSIVNSNGRPSGSEHHSDGNQKDRLILSVLLACSWHSRQTPDRIRIRIRIWIWILENQPWRTACEIWENGRQNVGAW